jgi:hypothetical protein
MTQPGRAGARDLVYFMRQSPAGRRKLRHGHLGEAQVSFALPEVTSARTAFAAEPFGLRNATPRGCHRPTTMSLAISGTPI